MITTTARLEKYFSAFTLTDRSKIFEDPDLVGFAFMRESTVAYLTHPKLETDGNVSGVIGDITSGDFQIVSIPKDALLIDKFQFIDSKSVAPIKQTIHVGATLDTDTLAIVVLGDKATDEELVAFHRQGRNDIYPPEFENDSACVVGIPRAIPIFNGDPLFSDHVPIPTTDLRDMWLFLQLKSKPISANFLELPGFTWLALWDFPATDCPGTVHRMLKFYSYQPTEEVWQTIHRRVMYRSTITGARSRPKRPLTIQGSPVGKRIINLSDDIPASLVAPVRANPPAHPAQSGELLPPSTALLEVYTHLALFYCIVDVDDNAVTKVTPPIFNQHFQQGLEKASDKKSLFKYVQRNFLSLKRELAQSKHHLCSYVDYTTFKLTQPLFNLFAEASIMTKPFQSYTEVKELAGVVSLASFALPQKKNPQYSKYVTVSETNDLDAYNEQSKEKSEPVQIKLFPFTFFDRSFEDVMTAVANFLAFSHSIVQMSWNEDDPGNPTIVRMMLQLVQIVKNIDLKHLFVKVAGDRSNGYPWIYHSLFLSFQNLFQHTATLLMSPAATMAVQNTSFGQIPLDEFEPLLSAFAIACKELKTMTRVLAVCADSFKACPESYYTVGSGFRTFSSGVDRILDNDKAPHATGDREQDTKGWLKLLDSSKRPYDFRPPSLSDTICLYHAFEGYQCKYRTCAFKHCNGLSSLSVSDQAIVKSYIDANSSLYALNASGHNKRGGVRTQKRVVLSQD